MDTFLEPGPDELADDGQAAPLATDADAIPARRPFMGPLAVYYLRLEIDIIRGAADFDEAVGRICFRQNTLAGGPSRGVSDQLP